MTPAIRVLEQAGVAFTLREYHHDPATPAYGLEAAEALGLPPGSVFKTLLAMLDNKRLAVALVPVSRTLDLKALAHATGAKKASMAEAGVAERATGYVVGGISPLGQKQRLATFIDAGADALEQLHVSAGRRGLEVSLAPTELIRLIDARLAPLSR